MMPPPLHCALDRRKQMAAGAVGELMFWFCFPSLSSSLTRPRFMEVHCGVTPVEYKEYLKFLQGVLQ